MFNSEVNLDLCAYGEMGFTQDADTQRAHVREIAQGELAAWSKQYAPIRWPPRCVPAFSLFIVRHVDAIGPQCPNSAE